MGRFLPAALVALALLSACAGGQRRGEPQDGPPERALTPGEVPDAVPRAEPRARYGNHSPYEVLGKRYEVLPSSAGYRARGLASWYGRKFHGRRTSSGEVFDMHKATAAHRSLPLPTYAEVTNLENGRRVIVKINDRGPFHGDRLIDLSYGAAVRLGMAGAGTARVEVRALDVAESAAETVPAAPAQGTFLQIGAFRQRHAAEALAGRMMQEHLQPVSIHERDGLFKVWIGPYEDAADVGDAARRAVELGLERPHTVRQ